MAKNINEVVKESSKEVIFDFSQVESQPEAFTEWLDCGDKGVPFEFFDGEIITLPKFEQIKIWGRREKIGKKTYPVLYTAIMSNRQGATEMPLSILRRLPALREELQQLMENNAFGAPLLSKMSDIKRLAKLSKLAGTNPILVTEVVLHRNGFDDNGKVVKDDPSKPESERTLVVCHRFNPAS